jgi:3-oxoacyl-[acyl-carrier-protein] synthase III
MRWDDLYIAGTGMRLGTLVPVEAAVRRGDLSEQRRDEFFYESVSVSTDLRAPELAIAAGRSAVARSGIDPTDFGLAFHCYLWYQGRYEWAAANYVAGEAVSAGVPALGVMQRCNGALNAVELAGGYLAAGARGSAALVTAGDCFSGPKVDRWTVHSKAFYGDGGSAAVVARGRGFARILSTVSKSDNYLERMNRGTRPLDFSPPDTVPSGGLAEEEFAAAHNMIEIYDRLFTVISDVQQEVLKDAGVTMDDVKYLIDAATRGNVSNEDFVDMVYGIGPEKTTWDFGRTTGHLGAGDQFAGLTNLLETGRLAVGDLVLLMGGGSGFSCSAVLLEIVDVPDYQAA